MIRFHNTLHRKKQIFKPLKNKKVGLYTCGPTVYWFAHIGNLRTYVFEDILKRVLEYSGYKVKHVMNITDVGHLTSDADTGEDKLEKALKREGLKPTVESLLKLADKYTKAFKVDLAGLNILEPDVWCKATEHVKEMIRMDKMLEKNGYTYETDLALYFDVTKFKNYTQLSQQKLEEKSVGARDEVEVDSKKKHPADFALWFKLAGKNKNHIMHWPSPWGEGFPGWHIECSAMSTKYLGDKFDIHCGGIDHITVHHTNEIAQNDGAYKHQVVNYWLHGEFLLLKQGKMAKSGGNIIILEDVIKKEFNPLAYRYLCLGTHYRSKLTFSWESLKGAQNSLNNLYKKIAEFADLGLCLTELSTSPSAKNYQKKFLDFIQDDLNMPKALALMWRLVKDKKIAAKEKYKFLKDFDKIFGLDLEKIKSEKIPKEIKKLVEQRENYRQQKNWQKSDAIRAKIKKMGYQIKDTDKGPKIFFDKNFKSN
jgi:cysteinyl-tRNA synthetase